VFLVQDTPSLLFQNLSIRHGLGYFDCYKFSLSDIADRVRSGTFRDIVIGSYRQAGQELICKDFYWIEKHIGPIRYLAVFNPENTESH
jgi:hypothetical protein